MDNHTDLTPPSLACQCGKNDAQDFSHRADDVCIYVGLEPLPAHLIRDLQQEPRFFTKQNGRHFVEVLGTAVGSGARHGRDDMIVYFEPDSGDLRYTSKPDFEYRMTPAENFNELASATPLRVIRWEKRERRESEDTKQGQTKAMLAEIADYRRVAAHHCDPLRRYLRTYQPVPLDTTRLTRYGPNEWAAGSDDEFGPREEGEYVKLADVHALAAQVAAVTPDAMLSLLHYAANQPERPGHHKKDQERYSRIVGPTIVGRPPNAGKRTVDETEQPQLLSNPQ
jgi:hypothetical protein